MTERTPVGCRASPNVTAGPLMAIRGGFSAESFYHPSFPHPRPLPKALWS